MDRISAHLHKVVSRPCDSRPFVCHGKPKACEIIVVGDNPATSTETDWWEFWSDESGFDLTAFVCHYEESRRKQGKRLTSNTRLRLNRLRKDHGLSCLELNAYVQEGLGGHSKSATENCLLEYFISILPKLRAIIAHGQVAQERLRQERVKKLLESRNVEVFNTPHFKNLSYAKLDSLAAQLTKTN